MIFLTQWHALKNNVAKSWKVLFFFSFNPEPVLHKLFWSKIFRLHPLLNLGNYGRMLTSDDNRQSTVDSRRWTVDGRQSTVDSRQLLARQVLLLIFLNLFGTNRFDQKYFDCIPFWIRVMMVECCWATAWQQTVDGRQSTVDGKQSTVDSRQNIWMNRCTFIFFKSRWVQIKFKN
jgi:hypothetical protein